jgi:hypothetical protein
MIVPLVNELSADTAMTSSAVVKLAHSKLLHHELRRIELESQWIHGELRTSLGERACRHNATLVDLGTQAHLCFLVNRSVVKSRRNR